MTNRLDALKELELAILEFRWTAYRDARKVFGSATVDHDILAEKAYVGSLDAAKALHEATVPRWSWNINDAEAWVYIAARNRPPIKEVHALDPMPARAWLLAIIRALISEETSNE